MLRRPASWLLAGLITLFPILASGDAIVRNQSMFASTIAEIFVERDRVRVELEIGGQDLAAFASLMPDSIYQNITGASRPYPERLAEFFSNQLVLAAGDNNRLPGALVNIGPGKRQQRDPITGEVIAQVEEEDVVRATLVYALPDKPDSLVIQTTLGQAAIGFVAYHGTVAVNDFRYLGPVQVLDLNWEDAWYSAFRRPALRRSYSYAMSGFLYVEPYEVRKELILRPKDLQFWIDLGLDDVDIIPVERQDEIKQKIQEFLSDRMPVKIDGQPVEGELTRINFLERTLKSSRVIDPPEPLPLDSAIIGVIYTFPVDTLPENVTMDWELFNDRIQFISAASVDEAGPLPTILDPEYNVLEWKNFLKNPTIPKLVDAGEVPSVGLLWLQQWRLALVIAVLVLAFGLAAKFRSNTAVLVGSVAGGVFIASLIYWAGQGASPSRDESREIATRLLRNIYHAFDYRKEEKIYDVLAYSVEGDLLTQIYLETRKGLVLANQGGARTKVIEVAVNEIEAEDVGDGKIDARVSWDVTGSVGHWGHVHSRKNRYNANLLLSPESGNWKIENLEILDEERVN